MSRLGFRDFVIRCATKIGHWKEGGKITSYGITAIQRIEFIVN